MDYVIDEELVRNYNLEIRKSRKIGSEIVSNLELQMALYFNVIFFPFWLVTIIFIFYEKYDSLPNLFQIITTIVLLILIPVEVFRLYLGYVGNLLEKIPELAGFWMLSLLLQSPLQLFLLIDKSSVSSQNGEQTIQLVMCILLLVQLVYGFIALKKIAHHRANKFHLTQIQLNESSYSTSISCSPSPQTGIGEYEQSVANTANGKSLL